MNNEIYIPITSYIREDNLQELVQRHYERTLSIRKTIKRLADVDNIHTSRNRIIKYLKPGEYNSRLDITQDDLDYLSAQGDIKSFREVRRHIGLRQQDIAEYLGVSQSSISHMERTGDYKISDLLKLARLLGGSVKVHIDLPGMKPIVLDHSNILE